MIRKRRQLFSEIDIYPVISSKFTRGRTPQSVLSEVAEGGARIVQMREKNLSKRALYELGCAFREICSRHNMLFIVNDHLDLALALNADGVHLGQDDLPLRAAREIAPELLIGVSTHSRDEALEAQAGGADYINLGPIYPTNTKETGFSALGEDFIRKLAPSLRIPFTVMGGIKARHIPLLLSLGASKIAMVTEISLADDISQRVRELRCQMLRN